MLNEREILEYAVKGVTADIEQLEKEINRGKRLLLDYERGQKPKTTKTPDEIREIIMKKKAEIEVLDKHRFHLWWKLDVEMEK